MADLLKGAAIVVGVSGGIAAYKACELVSRLTQQGARVDVVMTAGAQRFVTPLTFQALSHRPVHTSLWSEEDAAAATADTSDGDASGVYAAMPHIGLADRAAAILIAPASADLIARLAQGRADDLLTTLALATHAPLLVAPAMNPAMLAHRATQANLQRLRELGYGIIEPASGHMACEHIGSGRLPETAVLIGALRAALGGGQLNGDNAADEKAAEDGTPGGASGDASWRGRTVLVTAGPTREAIDPVRYLTNRSSGKMGYAVAAAAARRGAQVLLVSGPTRLPVPQGVERIEVVTAQQLCDAATVCAARADIVIAAAAAADFRPRQSSSHKQKKRALGAEHALELVPTADTLAALGAARRPGQVIVGFAAETEQLIDNARAKLLGKGCDAVVANDITRAGAGFDVDTNRVCWVTAGNSEEWPLLSKTDVAERICAKIEGLMDRAPQ